jgi:hypothetical protein
VQKVQSRRDRKKQFISVSTIEDDKRGWKGWFIDVIVTL